MMSLGVIGYYIARIYEEVLGRPRYIIAQRTENAAPAADCSPVSAGCDESPAAQKERSPYEN